MTSDCLYLRVEGLGLHVHSKTCEKVGLNDPGDLMV